MRLDRTTIGACHWELVDYWTDAVITDRFVWANTGTFEICLPRCDPQEPRIIVPGLDGSLTKTIFRPFRIRLKATAPDHMKRLFPEYVQP